MKKLMVPLLLMMACLWACGDIFSDGIDMERKKKYMYYFKFGTPSKIYRSHFDGTGEECLNENAGDGSMVEMAVDLVHGYIYWLPTQTEMRRMDLDGSNVVNNFASIPIGTVSLAVCPSINFIYYGGPSAPYYIKRMNCTTKTVTDSSGNFIDEIEKIVVDDAGDRMFILIQTGNVYRTDRYGNSPTLVTSDADPTGTLCIDTSRNTLYYTTSTPAVNFKNLSTGTTGALFTTASTVKSMAFDPVMDVLYWSDTGLKRTFLESNSREILQSGVPYMDLAIDP